MKLPATTALDYPARPVHLLEGFRRRQDCCDRGRELARISQEVTGRFYRGFAIWSTHVEKHRYLCGRNR
jgi:hypothetical protein